MKDAPRKAVHIQTLGRLLLLLAVPVAGGLAIWLLAQMAERRAEWIQHTFQVQVSLEHLATDIKAAEDNQRGYLLTGEGSFLSAYQGSQRSAHDELSRLAAMTADNPRQEENLKHLGVLLNARFSFQQSLIDAYTERGRDVASAKAAMDQQTLPTGSIQSLLDAMREKEDLLLASREADLADTRSRFYWALAIGYALIVVIVVSLFLSVRRYSRQSVAAEARLSEANARLDQRVRERTALLKGREELLNTFVQHVPAAVAMLNRDMHYLQVSDRWCAEYGFPRSSMLGASHY